MEIYEQSKRPIAKWITAGLLFILFILITVLVKTGHTMDFDKPFLDGFIAMRNGFLTTVMKSITFCANTLTIIIVCVVLLILPTRFRFGAPAALAVAVSSLINALMKLVIGRSRPDLDLHLANVSSFSFPSGHANSGFVFYILLMILLRRYFFLKGRPGVAWFFTVTLSLLAFLIGISRIYLGVHYPTDVLGGWLLAGIVLIGFMAFYETFYPQKWVITYHQPAWQMIRRRRPWRRPQKSNKNIPMVEFPSTLEWTSPRVNQPQDGDEPNMMLQQNQAHEPARERRRIQVEKMRNGNNKSD